MGFRTYDHLQTPKTLKEKRNECNLELLMAFMEISKAFETIETWQALNAQQRQ